MKTKPSIPTLAGTVILCLLAITPLLRAQETTDDDPPLRRLDAPAQEAAAEAEPADEAAEDDAVSANMVRRGEVVQFNHDIHLRANEQASKVVAIFGNVVIDGEVTGEAVAIFGDVTVNGRVRREAVAVMGDMHVEGQTHGETVAVMGKVSVGPRGSIHGETVAVGGGVDIVPGGFAHGQVNQVSLPAGLVTFARGLRVWFHECLLWGRPLAFNGELLWAWGLAGSFLVFYLLLVLLFNSATTRCAEMLETRPGMTVVAALLTALLTPILTILLSFVAVGALLGVLMFLVGLFGKATFILWLGRRVLHPSKGHTAIAAAVVGGLILTLIYTVPFLGFIMFKVSGILGTGMVVYLIIASMQAERNNRPSIPTPEAAPAGTMAAAAAADPAVVGNPAPVEPPMSIPPMEPQTPSAEAGVPPPMPPPATARMVDPAKIQFSLLPRAGFWIRLAATMLDVILVALVTAVPGLDDYFVLCLALYHIILWALRGTTIGGVICGLKVVRLDDRPFDWSMALVRGLGAFLSFIVFGLGFIWVAFDPDNQSWHDKIAGTTIVRVPKGVSLI